MPYDPKLAEPKWQSRWARDNAFATDHDTQKPKAYLLDMFPYPSGAGLHVGHCANYLGTDVLARLRRAQGYRVLHPMGWDAFGLPAENYAIRTGVHPSVTTEAAIANFRRQINALGFSYDWSREVNTTDPAYIKWTQWIFLRLLERGLAYEAVVPINWCPSCRTGLANEEVKQGRCERCGTAVEPRDLRQWLLRITAYADRLLADLDGLDWPAGTLAMQREWIGRREGAELVFACGDEPIAVFTTRPETVYGATFLVLAPEHPSITKIVAPAQRAAVDEYLAVARSKSVRERLDETRPKTGVYTGGSATNPATGDAIPVWIADYVLGSYGTGAIMAVPAHDQRDAEFAKVYDLPVKYVVDEQDRLVNSGPHTGFELDAAKRAVVEALAASGGLARRRVAYKLRDWVFSRQRYWGEPIPVVHCAKDGVVPVPENELPIELPAVERYAPSGTGESPLAVIDNWANTSCPKCGGFARRETNTMPQWAGSCWYYLRFVDPRNDICFSSKDAQELWMPVDIYIGGAEHAVLHLLYARFWHKVLYDLGYVTTPEPFPKLRHQGTVLSYAYRDERDVWYSYDEIEYRGDDAIAKVTGEKLRRSVEKMSKSKKNVIDPFDVIRDYSADALRVYELFMGDYEQPKPWDTHAIKGVDRFLQSVWRLIEVAPSTDDGANARLRHKTIKLVTERIEALRFNTAISALMEYINAAAGFSRSDQETLVKLIAPFAPHIAEEAWEHLGYQELVCRQPWPTYDPAMAIDDSVVVAIQVQGKTRGTVLVARNSSEQTVRESALVLDSVRRAIGERQISRVIFAPDRLLNFVLK